MNKSFAKVLNGFRELGKFRLSQTAKLGIAGTALFVAGCGPQDTGDVIGVQGRRVWFHPQPYGMVYVPSGTFHTGQADQDIFASYIQPNKQITITAFWMDETEITNNEYRQFVHFVIDSIARYMVDDDALFIEDEDGNRVINYDVELDWEKYREELEDMYYRESERFRGKKQIDTRKLYYVYQWYDMVMAANLDRDKYAPMDRAKFIKKEKTLIYPDTLAFVRDFTYSFNEPQARHYFHHVKFDDYPVVGVNWHQAVAFRTRKLMTRTLSPAVEAWRLVRCSFKLPAATAEVATMNEPAEVCVLMQATTTSVAATLLLVTVNSASAPAATVYETVVMTPL